MIRKDTKRAKDATEPMEPKDRAFTWLLLCTSVVFLRPQDIFPPLEVLHLAEIAAVCGLVALVYNRMSHGRPITRMTPEFVGVLMFGAVILLTAPFSLWPGGSLNVFTDLYAKVILIYLLAVNAISSPRRLDRLTTVLVVCVGYIAFRAVVDYARGVNLVGATRVRGSVGGILENPNDLALNMVALLPLAALMALRRGPVWTRLAGVVCAMFMIGAIVASGSRGGFLGFVAMIFVLGVFMVRRRPGFVAAGVLAAVCALPLVPSSYWTRLESITDNSKDETGSRQARETLFQESLQAYSENPFVGVGAGEFKDWNNATRVESWHESHNVLLQVAAELGTIGLLAFSFLVFRAFIAVVQTRRLLKRKSPEWTPEEATFVDAHSAAMLASLVGWFVCALFASVAYNWTFYYLLALAATPRDILRARLPGRTRKRAFAVAPPGVEGARA